MFNQFHISQGYIYDALWSEFDVVTKKFETPLPFKFKVIGDDQIATRRIQQQSGVTSSRVDFSIKVLENYAFKQGDKIEILNFEQFRIKHGNYKITSTNLDTTSPNSLSNMYFKDLSANKSIIIHLNKDL